MTSIRHVAVRSVASRSYAYGVAATEFAIVCPLLLLLALACSDFGRIAHYHEVVANAARTGAETGATRQFTDFTRPFWEADDTAVRG